MLRKHFWLLILQAFLVCSCVIETEDDEDDDKKVIPVKEQIIARINRERAARGLHDLIRSDSLECPANKQASDLSARQFCSHIGSDGSDLNQRASQCNTSAKHELINCGSREFNDVVNRWMVSEYQAMILDKAAYSIGCVMLNYYWVCVIR